MANNLDFMIPTELEEDFIGNREIVISSLGRIYINRNLSSRQTVGYEFQIGNVYCGKGFQSVTIDEKFIKSKFSDYEEVYGDIEYVFNHVFEGADTFLVNISEYLIISDIFLRLLIKDYYKSNKQVTRLFMNQLIDKLKKVLKEQDLDLKGEDIDTLLKPVYYRFTKMTRNEKSIEKLCSKLCAEERKYPSKMTLYDIPADVYSGQLRLLEGVTLDLTEYIPIGNNTFEFKCVSLGRIEKFDLVTIYFNKDKVEKIVLRGKGYYLKKR